MPTPDAHLFRNAAGRPVSGAAIDAAGRWTWWSTATLGRRQIADSREDAIAQARKAVR